MQIKLATKKDIKSIGDITKNDGSNRPLNPKNIEKYLLKGDMYFLFCTPLPIGVAKLAFNKDGEAELFVISVKKKFQNSGIGKALLEYVEKESMKLSKRKLYAHVTTDNRKAIRFYYKNGFKKICYVDNLYKEGDKHIKLVKLLD